MINSLAKGKPLELLFFFVIPMVVGNPFQQLYSMADSIVMGRLAGEDTLAMVGSSFLVVFLSMAVAADLPMGCTVVISQFFGAGKIRKMKVTVSTALISLGTIGLIITGIGELAIGLLLKLLGTGPDVMVDSLAYLRTYLGGAIFLFLYNSLNGIYDVLGDSQTPLKLLMVSVLTNIVLDLLFAIKFNMGVAGVAWMILTVQGFYVCIPFFVLIECLRKMENELSARGATLAYFDMDVTRRIAKVGVPSTLQQSIVSVSMAMMQGLVSPCDKVFVASYTVVTKIDTLAMLPNANFFNATSSYAAQSIGAGEMDRVKQGYKSCMFMVFISSPIIATLIYLFGPQFLGLFLSQGAEGSATSCGLKYMKTVSVFYLLMDALFVGNGLLHEAGDMGAFMLSPITSLFLRVVVAYLLAHYIGASATWWSAPTGWAFGFIFSFLRVKGGKWISKSLME